jgi:ABC-type amino acid transport substrate-binding protein
MFTLRRRVTAVAGVTVAGGLAAVALAVSASSSVASTPAGPPGLMNNGTLVVGMNLQFKPEMYLKNGKPAGYDVDLLNKLAAYAHVKLKIDNLAFTGLIPGLQTKKFDLVSVGLSDTKAREQVVSFTKPYVPYALVVGVPAADANSTTIASLNQPGKVITALLGSTDQQLAKQVFPKATINALADQNSDFSLVATGRANAIVVEQYLLGQYDAANPGKLAEAKLKPLQVQYGSYAVQHGNTALIKYLNTFLCTEDKNGTLQSLYEKDFAAPSFPGVPACK